MVELSVVLYLTALGMIMTLLFVDSRLSKWKTILAVFGATVLMVAAVTFLYQTMGMGTLRRLYTPVVHLPALLLFTCLSRYRGWRLVFQFLSSLLFSTLIQHGAGLLYYLSGHRPWAMALGYVLFTPIVVWFLLRFLRPLFLQTLLGLRRGWWLLCLVMAAYYMIVVYLMPGYVGREQSSTILKPAVSLLMVGFYSVLMFLFSSIRKEMEARHSAQLSAFQASALQSRMEAVQAAEEAIRTERHDLRHRLQTVTELVARGEKETALTFIDAAQKRLDAQKTAHWCRPPVLDAVFSSYFAQAQRQGIRVDAQIALPDQLPVDEGELAIVFANALENAIHACMKLSCGEREIRCKTISTPGIMLEISNTCPPNVCFDDRGLPAADQKGHGLGVQSISAFCQKYGAVYQFETADGWFQLRIVL